MIARALAAAAMGQGPDGATPGRGGLFDPRNAVLLALLAMVGIGGGRRLIQSLRARRAAARLALPDVTPEEIEAAADHGRAGLLDLYRILATGDDAALRAAAGRALARLWAGRDLIAEEEKAVVTRGYSVDWKARRRYPRELAGPIPVIVEYGLRFLREDGPGIRPDDLEWSHRIVGANRASLEVFGPWTPGLGRVAFDLEPRDFPGNGPHRLVLDARVRPKGLMDTWELDLPMAPFTFEFDPLLRPEALLATADDARGQAFDRAIHWRAPEPASREPAQFPMARGLVLLDPPEIIVGGDLPCDLAHRVELEVEGREGPTPAGCVVVSAEAGGRSIPVAAAGASVPLPIEEPGTYALRAVLRPDPHLGWADPAIRSIWPGTITTGWAEARVVRA